jgi:hypothetical protein
MGKDYYILLGTILTLFIIFGCVAEQDDKEVKSIVPQRYLNTQKAAVADIFLNNLFKRNNKGEDSQKLMPFYFGTDAEAVNVNGNWSPVFFYYIYQSEPGDYESYFNAYLVWRDEIIYSGKQRVYTKYGKVVYGEFSPEEEFSPDGKDDLIPMANITVRKKLGS